jgi:hypothetical protein
MHRVARLILALAGAVAIAWTVAVFPTFRLDNAIADVARAVIAGEAFKPEILAEMDASTEIEGGHVRRSSLLASIAMIRLRRAEDAMRTSDFRITDQRLKALARAVDGTLSNDPENAFMWLVRFWLDSTRNGLRPDNISFLGMSYDQGPYEGWIALKRNRVALTAFAALPDELRERAIAEFVGLVKWGLVVDAADIAAGPGRPLRSILFPRLADLTYDQRRAFAASFYRRELDDVPVPGIAPPKPDIPMPVLPPDL